MAGLERPRCCVEPRCRPIHQIKNVDDISQAGPGDSWMCFGLMPEGIEFIYDGDRHANDRRSCTYTPLKGVVAYQECEADWHLLEQAYRAADAVADRILNAPDGEA